MRSRIRIGDRVRVTDEIFEFHPESPISGCVGRVIAQYIRWPGGQPTEGWWDVELDEPQITRIGMRSRVWGVPETALRRLR